LFLCGNVRRTEACTKPRVDLLNAVVRPQKSRNSFRMSSFTLTLTDVSHVPFLVMVPGDSRLPHQPINPTKQLSVSKTRTYAQVQRRRRNHLPLSTLQGHRILTWPRAKHLKWNRQGRSVFPRRRVRWCGRLNLNPQEREEYFRRRLSCVCVRTKLPTHRTTHSLNSRGEIRKPR
jgi:hypothetical protein